MTSATELRALLVEMGLDRPLAHQLLFPHRHRDALGRPVPPAPFHADMAEDWASEHPFVLEMVFRGGAKSTTAEESGVIGALYEDFRYCLVVSYSQPKAVERLAAIRHEFHTNEEVQTLFGDAAVLDVDTASELVTRRKVKFQALGRGQSLRGLKHLEARPDFIIIDDIEDRPDVVSPEARKKVWDWLTRDLLPALDPLGRVRMTATPLHPEAAPERLARDPSVLVRRVPIMYRDEAGNWAASWPERFSLEAAQKLEASYRARGELENFKQEYMVQAEAPETKPFKREMIHIFPQVRTWQAVYAMTDPARTVRQGSATTGHAVWSWINGKLVIWEAWGRRLLPNEIVAAMFDTQTEFEPVWNGVEEDGLNEFLLQPLRHEMARRGMALPLKAVKAPVGKIDFIRGLQPFFMGREVQFTKAMPDLEAQLLGFPTGDIDVPNALAYALKMRPGVPIYDEFGFRHISEDLRPAAGRPLWLCLNAGRGLVTGVVAQSYDGVIRVLGDVVREGDPGAVLADVVAAAQLEYGPVKLAAGPRHYDRYNNVGLVQAAKRLPAEVRAGLQEERGRAVLRKLLQRERQGIPLVLVSTRAKWTLNGLTAGYARALLKQGQLADVAEENSYKTLIEGLETFASLLEAGSPDDADDDKSYAFTRDGRRYVSLIGNRGR